MDHESEIIRQRIESQALRQHIDCTRSSLTEKLETLEDRVQTAKESVEEMIENVKHTVQDTVNTVKRTFDLKYQSEQHPWAMVGASFAAGLVCGRLLGDRTNAIASDMGRAYVPEAGGRAPAGAGKSVQSLNDLAEAGKVLPRVSRSSLMDRLLGQFHEEVGMVKELAIGSIIGVVRDMVKSAAPGLADEIERIADSATKKVGGKPIAGPIIRSTDDIGAVRSHEHRFSSM